MHNQNNTNNLAQFISIAIFSVLFGGISGLIWAFVLSKNFKSALILGASIGLFLGLT
jgi:ABC-type phosphate/phosphonate transport system permease subunit